MESGGEDDGEGEPPVGCVEEFVTLAAEFPAMVTSVSAFLASCSCLMTSSRSAASVAVVTRNEPSRVKVVLLASKVAVTPHSFSRFCFRSRQAANAHPTA